MDSARGRTNRSGWRVHIVGTGGQGVLTAVRLLCDTFVARGCDVVSGQLHGMAQRGGSVQSSVIINGGISPVIPRCGADFVLGFEPVETARAIGLMSPDTVVYMNTTPIIPYVLGQRTVRKEDEAKYPNVQDLADSVRAVTVHTFLMDGTDLAEQAGSTRALNMAMLGCLLGSGSLPATPEEFWDSAARAMPQAFRDTNRRAFFRGAARGGEFRLCEQHA